MKRSGCLKVLLSVCILLFFSCSEKEKKFVIGFSQCIADDPWRVKMLEEMERELAFHPELELVVKNANGNVKVQISDLEEFAEMQVDLLIVSPQDSKTLIETIEEIYNTGLPIIILDRKVMTSAYTAFIGANNYNIGFEAGEYALNLLDKKGRIVEIWGDRDASPSIERHTGFFDAISKYSEIELIEFNSGESTNEIRNANRELLRTINSVNVVFAHTDHKAIYAKKIFDELFPGKQLYYIGIDGLYGANNGIDFVDRGLLESTFLYPTGGQEAISTAAAILHNQPFNKTNELVTAAIDSANIGITKFREEKLQRQFENIELQKKNVALQKKANFRQKIYLGAISFALLAITILSYILSKSLKKRKIVNKKLLEKADLIQRQKNRIEEISKKAEENYLAKFKFFTNISHEFRTPLMLIRLPLLELSRYYTNQEGVLKNIDIIKRNAIRLERLINQLMDFRKIDNQKYQVVASKMDIVQFIKDFMFPFEKLAQERNIDFSLVLEKEQQQLWFDPNMIDKVLFNLFSNAFKFTPDYGIIGVSVSSNETDNVCHIAVFNNGKGIEQHHIDHVFDRYYHVSSNNLKGSGLGLSLAKELIGLHGGNIKVSSTPNEITTFEFYLPLGNEHFSKSQINDSKERQQFKDENDIFLDIEKKVPVPKVIKDNKPTVLIIEDSDDLLEYIVGRLSNSYNVITAINGEEGLNMALKEVPDVILSDLSLPGLTGLEITEKLKGDMRTSHIPIIIMTGRDTDQQRIEGLKIKADSYMVKPFSIEYLKENLNSILHNRKLLKQYYSNSINSDDIQVNKETEFIKKFKEIVTDNFRNHDFGVDDIYPLLGLSRVQLYRKINALLGCGVNDFIVNYRLQESKRLLLETSRSITEISFDTGFSSPSYFSSVYKKKYGLSPSKQRSNLDYF